MKTPAKFALLTSLYLAQGLPFGFFTLAVPVLMRSRGLSLPDIGLANALALPWALKFLWAPLVDRHGSAAFGRRRSWILPLQVSSAVTVCGLAFVDPARGIPVLMGALLLTNLFAATQDIATDGLAVELLNERERGHGNGIQVAAYRVGMLIGGGVLVVVFGVVGWRPTFLAMAAMLALSSIPIALYREPPPAARIAEKPIRLAAWLDVLRRPGMPMWIALLATYKAGNYLAGGMVKPFLIDRGMSLVDVGVLLGTAGAIAGLVGALLGGWAATRFSRRSALLGCGVLEIFGVLAYVASAAGWGGNDGLVFATILEHLTGGMATASLFTLMMDVCGEATEGTEYTVQASAVVIATGLTSIASGYIAHRVGYTAHFAISALVAVLGLAFVAWAFAAGVAPPQRGAR